MGKDLLDPAKAIQDKFILEKPPCMNQTYLAVHKPT